MVRKNHENDKCEIMISSEPNTESARNEAKMEINAERRRNSLRSYYGNDNDDGTEKVNALLTTSFASEEARATKNCNKSTFATTRSNTYTKHAGITTSLSMKDPTMFYTCAVVQNEKDLSSDDLSSNAPSLKQQDIIREHDVCHRRPSLTVASYSTRKNALTAKPRFFDRKPIMIKNELTKKRFLEMPREPCPAAKN